MKASWNFLGESEVILYFVVVEGTNLKCPKWLCGSCSRPPRSQPCSCRIQWECKSVMEEKRETKLVQFQLEALTYHFDPKDTPRVWWPINYWYNNYFVSLRLCLDWTGFNQHQGYLKSHTKSTRSLGFNTTKKHALKKAKCCHFDRNQRRNETADKNRGQKRNANWIRYFPVPSVCWTLWTFVCVRRQMLANMENSVNPDRVFARQAHKSRRFFPPEFE